MMNWIWTKFPVFTDLWTAVRYGKEEICLVDKNVAKNKKNPPILELESVLCPHFHLIL